MGERGGCLVSLNNGTSWERKGILEKTYKRVFEYSVKTKKEKKKGK